MDRSTSIDEATVIIRAPDGAEIAWRTQRLVSLGADPELAATIARSDADVHDIERLLDAGCPLDLAWSIVRPAEKPAPAAVAPAADDD